LLMIDAWFQKQVQQSSQDPVKSWIFFRSTTVLYRIYHHTLVLSIERSIYCKFFLLGGVCEVFSFGTSWRSMPRNILQYKQEQVVFTSQWEASPPSWLWNPFFGWSRSSAVLPQCKYISTPSTHRQRFHRIFVLFCFGWLRVCCLIGQILDPPRLWHTFPFSFLF
jgi:hypothetical protein